MSADRELLELAAKAAGIEINWFKWERLTGQWNPLTDDGDALRLAVTIGLDLQIFNGSKNTTATERERFTECRECHGEDPYAATRRAITRAAAAIGKAMP
jgi:hypothetical protein